MGIISFFFFFFFESWCEKPGRGRRCALGGSVIYTYCKEQVKFPLRNCTIRITMPHSIPVPPTGFQALILCGPGVSLNTFTSNPEEFPKALIPIANRPMVWYPLDWCYRMGITSKCGLSLTQKKKKKGQENERKKGSLRKSKESLTRPYFLDFPFSARTSYLQFH